MRKALIAMVVLLVLSAAGLTWMNVDVNAARDQVVMTESVARGDTSVVEGLAVDVYAHYNDQLFWDTTFTLGAEPQADTEYEFYQFKHTPEVPPSYTGLRLETAISYGIDWNANSGLNVAYNELYDSLKPGEEATKVIWLKDYYEYYPITAELSVPWSRQRGANYYPEDDPEPGTYYYVIAKLNELIKIPMLEEECVEISMSLSASGSSSSMGWGHSMEGTDAYYVGGQSVFNDEAVYFTFSARTEQGKLVDLSQLKEGYGIYRIPRVEVDEEEKSKYVGLDADRMEMVYELDPEWEMEWFELDPLDESHLRMITRLKSENTFVFTLIDLNTMETLQEFTLAEPEKEEWWFIQDEGEFIVMCLRNETAVVLVRDEEGHFSIDLTAPLADDSILSDWYDIDKMDMDYKDGRLAVVDTMRDEIWYSYESCGVKVLVLDETGEIFYGEYTSSLSKGDLADNYYYRCIPLDYDPLTIRWE